MRLFGPRPNTYELLEATKLLGLFRTASRVQLKQLRKEWVEAWRESGVGPGPFIVKRYGMGLASDGTIVPTKGHLKGTPLFWPDGAEYTQESAHRYVRDVRGGKVR